MLAIVSGRVIKGRGYGRKIGFPTVNLDKRDYERRNLHMEDGVYAGIATIPKTGEKFKAAIVISERDRRGFPKIEAYLLGFTGVLYGKNVVLSFIKYLRPFMSFATEEELQRQILKDITTVDGAIGWTN